MSGPVVATVGTTHPLAFAGLPLALLALADEGVRPVCVVAGVSAQDAHQVLAATAVDGATIAAQFEALDGAQVDAFHVGALLSAEAVHAVAGGVARRAQAPIVLDPVLAATGGAALGDAATRDALLRELVPRARLVTPNVAEAAAFLGRRVATIEEMTQAARALLALGAQAVLVKGGDRAGEPVDLLAEGERVRPFVASRIPATLRGTGDLLAASIAAALASGYSLDEAVDRARRKVREAIVRGVPFAGTRVVTWREGERVDDERAR